MRIRIVAVCFVIIIISCKSTIPESDNVPPRYILRITGDGFEKTFTSDDDLDAFQLNLKAGQIFAVSFLVSDAGGVSYGGLVVDDGFWLPTRNISADWTRVEDTPFATRYFWNGNRTNPRKSVAFFNVFKINAQINYSTSIKMEVKDFGGQDFRLNSASGQLNIFSADKTGLISFF